MNLAKAREDAEQAARVQASKRAKREATRAAAAAQAAAAKAACVREMQEQVCCVLVAPSHLSLRLGFRATPLLFFSRNN
jgi:hypothetical protein